MDQGLRPYDFFRYRRVWFISCSVQTENYAKSNRIRQNVKKRNDVAVYFVQHHLLANVIEQLQIFSERLKTTAYKVQSLDHTSIVSVDILETTTFRLNKINSNF